MKITVRHSPNHNARPTGVSPRVIVLHADVASSAAISIDWLLKTEAQASYHAIVERDGSITQLVADERRAWHAGVSEFAGVPNVNNYSLGLCLSNKQDDVEPFTEAALQMGVDLCVAWMRTFGIPLDCIATHEQIARPLGRKTDPGHRFPLSRFHALIRRRLTT